MVDDGRWRAMKRKSPSDTVEGEDNEDEMMEVG